jgi:carbon monoxide dehydrogenase subunit G
MLKVHGSVCIDAPVEKVWEVLSNLESIQLWVRSIRHSYCPEASRGVGALRICELKQATIHETIVAWDEGRSFTYRGEGAPMMKSATNTWAVESRGPRTLVTTSAEVELKGGVFGLILVPLVKLMSARIGAQSLASLKYLVEHGQPYLGEEPLFAAPADC